MPDRAADLSHLHACLPVRSLTGGKARLGGAIDPEERATLSAGLLVHVLQVLQTWAATETVHVVSGDLAVHRLARTLGAQVVPEPDIGNGGSSGLNAAIVAGREAAHAAGATALLVLPVDLPLLTGDALSGLLDAADAALTAGGARPLVTVAPADARGGTNALLLSPVDAIDPCFGPDSLERHLRAAAAADATVQVVVDPALGFDIDEPADLEQLDPGLLEQLARLGGPALESETVV